MTCVIELFCLITPLSERFVGLGVSLLHGQLNT
jgi:hypothetical protein